MRLLLEAYETVFVLWASESFDCPVSAHAKPAIVAVTHGGSLDCGLKNVVLVVPFSHEFEHLRIGHVANSFEDHIVTLL